MHNRCKAWLEARPRKFILEQNLAKPRSISSSKILGYTVHCTRTMSTYSITMYRTCTHKLDRRQSSSSNTSSASSSDDQDDAITTLNTSGHVSPAHSPTPILVNLSDTPPTPIGRGSSAIARGNNVSSHSNNDVAELVSSSTDSGLSQYSLFDPSQIPLNLTLPTYTNTGLSGNSGFQEVLTVPQSSNNSGTSLLVPASQPPSSSSIMSLSSRSSGQPTSVITSHVLPVLLPYPF